MPFSVNGIGTTYYGKRDIHDNGSYITTEWFIFVYLPIVPIGSFRVLPKDRGFFGNPTSYWTWKVPLCRPQVRNTYLAVLIGGFAIAPLFIIHPYPNFFTIYLGLLFIAAILYWIISHRQKAKSKAFVDVGPVSPSDSISRQDEELEENDHLDNPLDQHIAIQVSEFQLQRQETIQINVSSKNSTISLKLKPEMRNKKVRLRGVFAKGAGDLFVHIGVEESNHSTFDALHSQLTELAKIAWTTEHSFQYSPFLFNPDQLLQLPTLEAVVEVLLRHLERVAPGFDVPYKVPRIVVTPIDFAAGQFEVDEEGWVTIKVSTNFLTDRLAAHAILAHEICHYILENSGIRKSDRMLNEQYTDLCMFVCGFGAIFLAGYKREFAQQEYRSGHRLGYLSDAEYQEAQQYVMQLRQSDEVAPPSELDGLKKRLLQLVYDKKTCQRIINATRRKYPDHSEIELYKKEISRLERDRG
jgi:hypothetical protein